MGFFGKIKGWLNIGGVKVHLDGVPGQIETGAHTLSGKAVLTAKDDREVLSVTGQLINERTFKEDGEEQTEVDTLGSWAYPEGFEMKAGETKEIEFSIDYVLEEKLRNKGGLGGAVGKLGSFAMGNKDSYSVVIECDVKGTMLDPSDSKQLKVAKG